MSDKFVLFWARSCNLGSLPKMPGTFGSLPGILLWLPTTFISDFQSMIVVQLTIALVLIISGIWLGSKAEQILGQNDPGEIVIDETAGMFIALISLPLNLWIILSAFVLFRIFDILKPFPINIVQKLPGGWGIMIDDILAGLVSLGILKLVILLF